MEDARNRQVIESQAADPFPRREVVFGCDAEACDAKGAERGIGTHRGVARWWLRSMHIAIIPGTAVTLHAAGNRHQHGGVGGSSAIRITRTSHRALRIDMQSQSIDDPYVLSEIAQRVERLIETA